MVQPTTAASKPVVVNASEDSDGSKLVGSTKYQQLLAAIELMRKDVRPTYMGNKICVERLKKFITLCHMLVWECIVEAEKDRQRMAANGTAKNQ